MTYITHNLRSVTNHCRHLQRQVKRAVTRWNLRIFGRRILGEMPRKRRVEMAVEPLAAVGAELPPVTERLLRHLAEFTCVQHYASEYPFFADTHPTCKQLAHDAAQLAYELSLYPRMQDCPPLNRAYTALRGHWRESWTIGGITEAEYRTAVKCAALFLRQRSVRVQHSAMELINGQ